MNWLEEICAANDRFQDQVNADTLPTQRQPCPYAIVTCMDPRVNLESIGILPFSSSGELRSQIRIIKTIGGVHEARSLAVGILWRILRRLPLSCTPIVAVVLPVIGLTS